MIGRRALIGLSLLGALLLCLFAVQSASAVSSINTTAVTCVFKGGFGLEDFSDSHCNTKVTPGEGSFVHEIIASNKTTEVSATNQNVTESTKISEPAVLKSKIGLTAVEITCNTVQNLSSKSEIHNIDVGGTHALTGQVRTLFTTCTVNKPAKCTVQEPIESNATVEGAEKLGAGTEMGIELKGKSFEETFAEITFLGTECALKSKTFKVQGSVIGTSGPTTESSQATSYGGATVVFTPKSNMQSLKLGVEKAEFSTIVTPKNAGSGTPIAATTST
jgi:hypothetical protein